MLQQPLAMLRVVLSARPRSRQEYTHHSPPHFANFLAQEGDVSGRRIDFRELVSQAADEALEKTLLGPLHPIRRPQHARNFWSCDS